MIEKWKIYLLSLKNWSGVLLIISLSCNFAFLGWHTGAFTYATHILNPVVKPLSLTETLSFMPKNARLAALGEMEQRRLAARQLVSEALSARSDLRRILENPDKPSPEEIGAILTKIRSIDSQISSLSIGVLAIVISKLSYQDRINLSQKILLN